MDSFIVKILAALVVAFVSCHAVDIDDPPTPKPPPFQGGGISSGLGAVAGTATGLSPTGSGTAHVSGGASAASNGGSSSNYGEGSTWIDANANGTVASAAAEGIGSGNAVGGTLIQEKESPSVRQGKFFVPYWTGYGYGLRRYGYYPTIFFGKK